MNYLQDIYFSNLNPVFNIGGYFSISALDEWAYKKHKFDQCKFYYVVEGECVITIDDERYSVKAGDWIFIPAGAEHSYYNVKGATFSKYWMHFDIYPNADIVKFLSLPYKISVGVKGKVQKLFSLLVECAKTDKLCDKLTVKACIINLLVEFVKVARPEGISVKSREQ